MAINVYLFMELHVVLLVTGLAVSQPDRYSRGRDYMRDEANHKSKLTVTTLLEEPFMMLKRDAGFVQGNERFEGYLAEILDKLSHYAGFSYEIRLVKDGKLGKAEVNGTWSGMIGELQRGEANIAAAPITVTSQRLKVIDFSASFMTVRSVAILKKPRRRSKNRRAKIKTVGDLLNQRGIAYGVIEDGIAQRSLRASRSLQYRRLWTHMANSWPSVFVHNVPEGVERSRREDYAFILDTPMAEYMVGREPCDLYMTEPFQGERTYALGLAKENKDLLVPINEAIMRMRKTGELQILYNKWWLSQCGPTSRESKNRKRNKNSSPDDASTPLAGKRSASGSSPGKSATCKVRYTHFLIILSLFAFSRYTTE